MCGDSSKQRTKSECPFCHEVSRKENIFGCIRALIVETKNKSSWGDPTSELAALLEMWQFFEMEDGDHPCCNAGATVHRVQAVPGERCKDEGVEDERRRWHYIPPL